MDHQVFSDEQRTYDDDTLLDRVKNIVILQELEVTSVAKKIMRGKWKTPKGDVGIHAVRKKNK